MVFHGCGITTLRKLNDIFMCLVFVFQVLSPL